MTANVKNYVDQADSTGDNQYNFGGSVVTGTGQSLKKIYLSLDMTDVSTASTSYIPSPVAGTISKIYVILGAAITVANSIVTAKIGATDVTDGAVTLAFTGSAAGSVFSATPSAANTVAAGSNINFTTDGASSTTSRGTIVVEITLS